MDGFEIQSRLFYYVDKNVYGGIKERIEYMFAAFCKVVLGNAAFTAYRDFGRKQKREVSLDYLISEASCEPFTIDSYFEKAVNHKKNVPVQDLCCWLQLNKGIHQNTENGQPSDKLGICINLFYRIPMSFFR